MKKNNIYSIRMWRNPVHAGILYSAFEKFSRRGLQVSTIEAGDYIVNYRIAFKRLTLDDILISIFEGEKLSSKIGDMTSIYERKILIIEGEDPFFPGRPFNLSFILSKDRDS